MLRMDVLGAFPRVSIAPYPYCWYISSQNEAQNLRETAKDLPNVLV